MRRGFTRREVIRTTAATAMAATAFTSSSARARTEARLTIRFRRGGLLVVPDSLTSMKVAYLKEYKSGCCTVPAHEPLLVVDAATTRVVSKSNCAETGLGNFKLSGDLTLAGASNEPFSIVKFADKVGSNPGNPWDPGSWRSFGWIPVLNGKTSKNALHATATATSPAGTHTVATLLLANGEVAADVPGDRGDVTLWAPRAKKDPSNPMHSHKLSKRAISDNFRYSVLLTDNRVTFRSSSGCELVLEAMSTSIDISIEAGSMIAGDSPFEPGGQLDHFCSFYQFTNVPEPEQFVPCYAGDFWTKPSVDADEMKKRPTPGRYCPGAVVVV